MPTFVKSPSCDVNVDDNPGIKSYPNSDDWTECAVIGGTDSNDWASVDTGVDGGTNSNNWVGVDIVVNGG